VSTNFQLADAIFANAVVKEPKNICLWLGVRRPPRTRQSGGAGGTILCTRGLGAQSLCSH
jgi:hypothetical protein